MVVVGVLVDLGACRISSAEYFVWMVCWLGLNLWLSSELLVYDVVFVCCVMLRYWLVWWLLLWVCRIRISLMVMVLFWVFITWSGGLFLVYGELLRVVALVFNASVWVWYGDLVFWCFLRFCVVCSDFGDLPVGLFCLGLGEQNCVGFSILGSFLWLRCTFRLMGVGFWHVSTCSVFNLAACAIFGF